MSSFAVISLVLVASLTVPVHAASWTTLSPHEYIDTIYYEGNYRCVRFDFGLNPLVQFNTNGQSFGVTDSYVVLGPASGEPPLKTLNFSVYPLGYKVTGGPPLGAGGSAKVIDIRDFKNNSALTVSSTLSVEMDIEGVHDYGLEYLSEQFHVNLIWSFYGYSSSGAFKGTVSSVSDFRNGVFQDTSEGYTLYSLPFTLAMGIDEFPDDVIYIVPVCSVIYTLQTDDPEISILTWKTSCGDFTLSTRTNMLHENSITQKSIESLLGDLNDKTDVIIEGTPEQNQVAQDAHDDVLNFKDEADRTHQSEEAYYDAYEDTADDLNSEVGEFADGPGFTKLSALVAPVVNWEHSRDLLLLLVAFINISIILFGR